MADEDGPPTSFQSVVISVPALRHELLGQGVRFDVCRELSVAWRSEMQLPSMAAQWLSGMHCKLRLHPDPSMLPDLMQRALQGGRHAVDQALLEQSAWTSAQCSNQLSTAARDGHLELCRLLLERQHNPAHADAHDSQALMHAAMRGNMEVCSLLLSQQHHPAHADAQGCRALMNAASRGYLEVCNLLLSQQHHPAHADAQNSWALVNAARGGHVEACRLLLQQHHHPAHADARDSHALKMAVQEGHLEVCRLLLMDEAISEAREELAQFLQSFLG